MYRRSLGDVAELPGLEVRTHSTTLHNPLFRFEPDLMITLRCAGSPPATRPPHQGSALGAPLALLSMQPQALARLRSISAG